MIDFSGLQTTSAITDEWKYPAAEPNRSGLLPVDSDPDHKLYWEEYGNPAGEPVMFLHGGPGGACAPVMARFFDPARYRVILFAQRGSGGSTLAMGYAIRHPEAVASLILRGIFIGAREDLLYMYQGNAASFADAPYALTEPGSYIAYPAEWRAFVEIIPAGQRGDMVQAYRAIFDMVPASDADRAAQLRAAIAWAVWEGTISNLIPKDNDPGKFGDAEFALSFAQIEAHFFANQLFLPPDYILGHVGQIAGIPIHIVHGRFDQVCPLTQASRLIEALAGVGAAPASYVRTNAGHSAMELETALALTAIMDGLAPIDAAAEDVPEQAGASA